MQGAVSIVMMIDITQNHEIKGVVIIEDIVMITDQVADLYHLTNQIHTESIIENTAMKSHHHTKTTESLDIKEKTH